MCEGRHSEPEDVRAAPGRNRNLPVQSRSLPDPRLSGLLVCLSTDRIRDRTTSARCRPPSAGGGGGRKHPVHNGPL